MLEIRPNCEFCDKNLPPDATDACICTYECTFCRHCVDSVLENVCPNCGGGFSARPIRPAQAYRPGISQSSQPASTTRIYCEYDRQHLTAFARAIKNIPPENR